MQIRQIPVGMNRTNCYILSQDGQGIIIDPGEEGEKILKEVERQDLKIEKIIITHGHFDHIMAADQVRNETGAPLYIHELEKDFLADNSHNLSFIIGRKVVVGPADLLLKEEEEISLAGEPLLKVIHTPGHSPGSISLYSAAEKLVISGDLVFSRGIGRTDFPDCSRRILVKSIEEKLLSLPEETTIYPGHGIKTTIGDFKTFWNEDMLTSGG